MGHYIMHLFMPLNNIVNQLKDQETVNLLQENKKLHAKSLEYEKREEELNLKIWKSKLKVMIPVVNKILVKIVSTEQRNRTCLVRKLCLPA
ncbi:hypothetical protein CJ030_MR1G029342 [Morella rubra]|uniref:Uncharacterized protein n=1 Tax=Morella rubra TaxID=262757 RepID=A0A6A1WU35_9ROSI|nr:hypothetical protein CJ030_MR1G029342 [Morella rubra]